MKEITPKEAITRIREFGLHHAIEDLPYSAYTVESFEVAIEALEKQTPKAPKECGGYEGQCPLCNAVFLDRLTRYCGNCGQALDWGGDKE